MLDVFMSALGSVLTLFFFVIGGFLFTRRGWVKKEFSGQLSFVVFNFFLPLMILKIILLNTDVSSVMASWHLIVMSFVAVLAGLPLGRLVSKLFKGRIAPAAAEFGCMFPNYIFMGMPVVLALFGEVASQTLVIYSLPLYLLVSSLGYMVIASSNKFDVKTVFNPCTIAIIIGFAWLALRIPVPGFIENVLNMGNNVVSPMAMFQVGMVIGSFKFDGIGVLKDAALFSLVRLLVLPVLTCAILLACGLRGLDVSVPSVIAAMPVAANMTITAGACGKYEDISAQLVFVSTVFSLITIPVVAVIINAIMSCV